MPDIVINPSLGKIDFFTVKGEQVTNSMRLGDASTILFTGALSASSITTGGGGAFVTSVQPTTNYLSKFTGNSTIANSLVYDNGTNVGIDTTSPNSKLDIRNGNLELSDSSFGNVPEIRFTANSSGRYVFAGIKADEDNAYNGHLEFWTTPVSNNNTAANAAFAERMRITSTGNVGIGTTSPGTLLQVHGSNPFVRINNTSTSDQGIKISYNNSDTHGLHLLYNASIALSYIDNTYPIDAAQVWGDILFRQNVASTMTTRMIIKGNSGNIGIGTTVPVAKLHINSTTAGATLLRTDGTNGTLFSVVDDLSDSLMSVNNSAGLPVLEVFTDDRIVAGQYGQNDFVVINNKVGIGTNNPTAKLQVSGSTSTAAAAFLGGNVGIGTTSPAQLLELKKTTGSVITILNYNDSVKFNINASSTGAGYVGMITNHPLIFVINDAEKVRVDTSGNVGIGTSSPAGKLHIVQNNDAGRYSYFGSNSGLFIKANDNSINSLLVLENTEAAANYGVSINFNLGYGGDQGTAGTSVLGSRIVAAEEQTWTSTSTTQDAFLAFYTTLNGTSGEKVRITSDGNVGIGTTTTTGLLTLNGTYPQLTANNPSTGSGVVIQLKDNGRDAGFMGHSTTTARLQFGSRGSSAAHMTIGEAGNVGIGTASPGNNLVVYNGSGWAGTDLNGTSGGELIFRTSGTLKANIYASTSTGFVLNGVSETIFQIGSSEKMRITSTGNVGIGLTSPQKQLDVLSSNNDFVTVGSRTLAVGNWCGIHFGFREDNNFYRKSAIVFERTDLTQGNSQGKVHILNGPQSGAGNATLTDSKITINEAGNVGIGTSSPNNKLDVVGATGTTINMSNSDDGNRGGKLTFISGSATGRQFYVGTNSSIYNLVFGIDSIEKARIDTNGNLGIGTTSPANKLEVKGADDATITAIFQSTAGGNAAYNGGIQLGNAASSQNSQIYHNSSGDNTLTFVSNYGSGTGNKFIFSPGGTETVRFQQNGYVGVGTSSPAAMLHVQKSQNSETTVIINNTNAGTAAAARLDLQSHASNYLTLQAYGQNFSGNVCGIAGAKLNTILDNALTANSTGLLIGTTSTNPLYFATANVVKMTLSAGGNLGIGTTSPTALLNTAVTGQIQIGTSNWPTTFVGKSGARTLIGNDAVLILWNDTSTIGANVEASLFLGARGSGVNGATTIAGGGIRGLSEDASTNKGYLKFETNNGSGFAEAMRIKSDGNVGIGTTSPVQKLSVVGNIYLPQSNFITWNNGDAEITAVSGYHLVFRTYTGASMTEKLRITSGGNVGIGTTVPSATLHLNSTTSGATLLRADGTSGTLFSVVDDLSDSLMSVNNSAGLPVLEVFADDRIVGGQYGQNDLVVVNNKVGIGTNNPLAKLHVTGSASVPAAVFMGNVGIGTTSFVYSNANRGDIEVYGSTDALISLRNDTANSYLQKSGNDFYFNNGGAGFIAISTNGSEKMRITSTGVLLVGNTSAPNPGAATTVSGFAINGSGNEAYISHKIDSGPCAYFRRDGSDGIVLAFYKANSSVGTIAITATTTTYNTTSDYRLKEDIQPLSSGLIRVNSLKPSVYNWKSDGSNGEGFLAHELAEVVPIAVTGQKDAVNDDGSINPQSVDLSKVVPILVAAIQELSAKVKTLEAKVQILESK